ncbi:hypothetical protein [Chryseobacterium cucumeris]|uniref:hypothetical protein n=1 Tax=Chryseobacterium cucumeris TaxID=1813611 RepID=UPI001F4A4B7F|nr:hypothetical protein [Chryseobacterium cucumeris]
MVKTAIVLRLLLSRNKDLSQNENKDIINSYEKIAINSHSDLRKATVNNAFSGKKRSSMVTIILIVESMGFTMFDFGEEYSKIKDEQILEFQQYKNFLKD